MKPKVSLVHLISLFIFTSCGDFPSEGYKTFPNNDWRESNGNYSVGFKNLSASRQDYHEGRVEIRDSLNYTILCEGSVQINGDENSGTITYDQIYAVHGESQFCRDLNGEFEYSLIGFSQIKLCRYFTCEFFNRI